MRRINMIEFEDICRKYHYNSFTISDGIEYGQHPYWVDFRLTHFRRFELYMDNLVFCGLYSGSTTEYFRISVVKDILVDDTNPEKGVVFHIIAEDHSTIAGEAEFTVVAKYVYKNNGV